MAVPQETPAAGRWRPAAVAPSMPFMGKPENRPHRRWDLAGVAALTLALAAGAAAQSAPPFSFTRLTGGDIGAAGNASGATWIDYDGDGDLDLFVIGSLSTPAPPAAQRRRMFRNDGGDRFTQVTVDGFAGDNNFPIGAAWADYDNDGDPDLFLAGAGSVLYRNDGGGRLSRVAPPGLAGVDLRGWSPSWADVDNDGDVDLFVTHPAGFTGTPQPNFLFLNNGPPDFGFTRVTEGPLVTGLAPYTNGSWADFDDDGDLDLFIGTGPASNVLGLDFYFRNLLKESGSLAFDRLANAPFAQPPRDGQTVNWIDYDNDGDLDFFVTNYALQLGGLANELYRNDSGQFTKVTQGPLVTEIGTSLANVWGDFDNDGYLDVFVATVTGGRWYRNNRDGGFDRIDLTPGLGVLWTAAAGDYDNDGDLDVFAGAAQPAGRHSLLKNETANGNHWLKIRCIGVRSNRSAVGAKLRLTSFIGGRRVTQRRAIETQNTFMGHNSLEVHFGLGDAALAEALEIEWPSGARDRLENLAADRSITVTEGEASGITPRIAAGGLGNAFTGAAQAAAPGQLLSIFGAGLGPATGAVASFDAQGRLPFVLGDVAVTVNGVPAPLLFARQDQVNIQVPYEVAGAAEASVVVRYRGAASTAEALRIAAASPGLFPRIWNANGTLNDAGQPAQPGGAIVLYATGQGVTVPASISGQVAAAPYPEPVAAMTLLVGGRPAMVLFRGQAPGTAGVMQINALIPADAEAGNEVPVVLRMAGAESSTRVAIRR